MAAVKGGHIIAIPGKLFLEAVYIVDRIINRDTDGDRGNGDGHHVERDTEPSHCAQYHYSGQQVWNDGNDCQAE